MFITKGSTVVLLVFALTLAGRTTIASADDAGAQVYSQDKLQQMVAPIALYPDALVSQILIASTYPVQIVEAYQWLEKNKGATGAQAQEKVKSEDWDPSVKSLIAFPQIVERMFKNLEWTEDLGEAFVAQQADVLRTIQDMRQKAYAAGNLKSTSKQTVVVNETTIVIQPAQPQVVYVPTYNPTVVYGSAWAPASWYYPPAVYAPPPGYVAAAGVLAFGAGVAVGAAWNSTGCSWSTGNVYVNNNYYRPVATPYSGAGGRVSGANGSVAHRGNTTAAYNANTGEVKSYNSATGNTRSAQVEQGARGTAVQGENGSVARAGNTTAAYNKNTGEVKSYNSATGNTRSGNTNNAGTSSWQHNSAQRQGQPYGDNSLNRQYGGSNEYAASARGSGQRPAGTGSGADSAWGGRAGGSNGGGGGSAQAASDRGWASRGGGGSGSGGRAGGGGGGRGGGGGGGGRGGGGRGRR